MSALTFFALPGKVFLTDGPWEARLTEDQCDRLLAIFDEAGAVSSFNNLYTAASAAGFIPYVSSRPALRVVKNDAA